MKFVNYIMKYNKCIILCFIIIVTLYIYNRRPIIEPMVFNSNNMHKNVYNKYDIQIDNDNKILYHNNQAVSFANNFNSGKSAKLSNNKLETSRVLKNNDLPVCNFVEWSNNMNDVDNLHNINSNLSFPLVIKYNWGEKGNDVYTDIIDNNHILEKVHKLKGENKNSIIIEEQTTGNKYRIMVLNNKLIYTSQDVPPRIVGDGYSTIKELIDKYPKTNDVKPIFNINIDLLSQQGYKLNDVLENNKEVTVSNVVSVANGGKQKYIEEYDIHPFNVNMFLQINKILGLNFSGIDYMCDDLSIPYLEQGKIIEVNPYPGFSTREQKNQGIVSNWVNAVFG